MLPNLPHISLLGKWRFRLRVRHVAILAVAWAFFNLATLLSSTGTAPLSQAERVIVTQQAAETPVLDAPENMTTSIETVSVSFGENITQAPDSTFASTAVSPSGDSVTKKHVPLEIINIVSTDNISPQTPLNVASNAASGSTVSSIKLPKPKPGQKSQSRVKSTPQQTLNPIQRIAERLSRTEPAAGIPRKMGNILIPQQRPESFMKKASFNPHKFIKTYANKRNASSRKVTVSSGDTLSNLLTQKIGLAVQDAYDTVENIKSEYSPQNLRPGHTLTAYYTKNRLTGNLEYTGLKIDTDVVNSIVIKKMNDGDYAVAKSAKKLRRTLKAAQGTIDSSLYVEASRQGVPDPVILSMIRIYSWAVDFQRDLREGDQFEIMYEEFRTEDGQLVKGRGNMLYANLTLSNHHNPIYRYAKSANDIDFYEPDGSSVRKTLMKTPIDGARISSGFGRRKHPVLGYTKMHKGIDFAASRGTPIYAAGDGVLEKIGRNGSFGNYIRIRHHHGLKTAYAHMKGFKSGLHKGGRVKQGQIIGYVGTTGRSTGAHLHYEVHLNGRQVSPRKVKLPQGHSLGGNDLATFAGFVEQTKVQFADLGFTTTVAQN